MSHRFVLLLLSQQIHGGQVLRGIARYIRRHALPWRLDVREASDATFRRVLQRPVAEVAGAIGHFPYAYQEEMFAGLAYPTVNISSRMRTSTMPRVLPDNHAVGVLAAEHFLSRFYRWFAFVGYAGHGYSEQRQAGFVGRLEQEGLTCEVHEDIGEGLVDRLVRGPGPVAVLACNDTLAFRLVDTARSLGLAVPGDVAIMGADNDDALCETADVPLTSVDLPRLDIGDRAAELLRLLMAGQPRPAGDLLVRPLGVVARESTDSFATSDDQLRACLHFIRHHAGSPIDVAEVCRQTGVARRTLEKKCRHFLDVSPHQVIHRARFEHARNLLLTTHSPIKAILHACGFPDHRRFARQFREMFGAAPSQLRRAMHESPAMPGDRSTPTLSFETKRFTNWASLI